MSDHEQNLKAGNGKTLSQKVVGIWSLTGGFLA